MMFEVQSPVPGEEKPHVPMHVVGHPDGKQLSRKGPQGPGGHHVE